jgi:hypothetical protein
MEIKINSKFSPGDEAWMMMDNYPVKLEIIGLRISQQLLKSPSTLRYTYMVSDEDGDEYDKVEEEDLCKTKEELKQKIFG